MLSEERLEKIEALLEAIRAQVESLEAKLRPDPTCLTYPLAAQRLGVSLAKLKRMVKAGEIQTTKVGKVPMVPLTEIHRISTPPSERPKLAAAQRKAKWVPIPVGKKR
jgi:excisionase family DNA binding protein